MGDFLFVGGIEEREDIFERAFAFIQRRAFGGRLPNSGGEQGDAVTDNRPFSNDRRGVDC